MSAWDSLSIREKADMMKAAIRNGITTLPEIKQAYNEFAEGGDTVGEWADAIYQNNPKEEFLGEPEHHYDFTQSEEWADAHGYYPDARGHRDDRVKKPAHPSHPSRGTWEGDKFVLSELGMQNPNYTLFGLNDGGQDPQAVLTYQGGSVIPEITATPNGNYIYNPYDNIRLRYSEGGNLYGNGGQKKSGGSFYQTHRARWFNFLCKKGVNPVKAERLASYFSAQDALESGHGTSSAARQKNNYGGMQRLDKKTNKMVNISYGSINDYMNAKWKMMNSKFGRALNAKSIQEYANILNDPKYHGKGYMYGLYEGYRDGQPLDVARQTRYMNNYTKIMMDIAGEKGFKGAAVPEGIESDDLSIVQPENPYTQFIPFEPFNPQVFNNPQAFVAPTREQFEVEQPIVEAAKDYAYSPEQLEREERRQGLNNLSFILGMMNGGNGSSFADTIGMLTGNIAAKGGPIHIKPENRGKFTALKKRTGHSATWFKEHGTPAQRKMATFALNVRHWKHGYGGNLYDGTTEDSQLMNILYAGELPDVTVMPRRIANKAWDKVQERWVGDMPTYYAVNPETGKEEMLREIGNGKYSTYDDKHVFDVLGAEAAKKQREQWIKNGGNASDFDKVMLGTLGLGLAPIALPEAATGIWAASQTPAGQTLLAGTLGGEAWEALNHGITGQSWGDNLGDVIGLDKNNYLGRAALGIANPFYGLTPNIIYKSSKALPQMIRYPQRIENTIQPNEIVWDAKQMFRDGNNHNYTQEDVDILNSFIPEYKEIERISKANGTYLKMPDGSLWKGDPREWVIAQSKNVKANYGDEILTHGNSDAWINKNGEDVTGDILGKKVLWTSTNPYLGGTYGNKRYRFVIPKNADVQMVADAKGRYWRDVEPGVDTDRMVYPNLTEDNVVRINNVVDKGVNNFYSNEWPKPLPKESVMDYYRRVFIGDDLVLGENIPRKALLGNNGMFDLNKSNIFKGLIPTGVGTSVYQKNSNNN